MRMMAIIPDQRDRRSTSRLSCRDWFVLGKAAAEAHGSAEGSPIVAIRSTTLWCFSVILDPEVKVRTRQILSFAAVAVIVSLAANYCMFAIEGSLAHLKARHSASLIIAQQMRADLMRSAEEGFAYTAFREEIRRERFERRLETLLANVEKFRRADVANYPGEYCRRFMGGWVSGLGWWLKAH
ncbi:MAG: hypothetical protein HY319_01695 [Armatimonadetes bacterium]|nr:hypothetical protein [Armatimonadota bacterium]